MGFESTRSELVPAIDEAVVSVVRHIGTDASGRIKLPYRPRARLDLTSPGRHWGEGIVFRDEPVLDHYFESHWRVVQALPEVRTLSLVLARLPYVDLPQESMGFGAREEWAQEEAVEKSWTITRPVLECCLRHLFHGETKEEYVERARERIEAGARRRYFAERHTAPIVKLAIEGPDRIEFGEEFRLRRLTPSERTLLCDTDDVVPNTLSGPEAFQVSWVMEMDVSPVTEEEPDYFPCDPSEFFKRVLTAVRLQRPGRFYIPEVTVHSLPGESADFGSPLSRFTRVFVDDEPVVIKESEIPGLKLWIQTISPAISRIQRGSLEIALERFNDSHLRPRYDDAVLDATISLEALLLGDKNDSPGTKLATRGAMLLGKSLDERHALIDAFKRCYKTRNHIVHGNTLPERPAPERDVLDLVRRTFVAFLPLLSYGSQRDVLRALDDYSLASPTAIGLVEFIQDRCAPSYGKGWEEDRTGNGMFPAEPRPPEPPERGDSDDS